MEVFGIGEGELGYFRQPTSGAGEPRKPATLAVAALWWWIWTLVCPAIHVYTLRGCQNGNDQDKSRIKEDYISPRKICKYVCGSFVCAPVKQVGLKLQLLVLLRPYGVIELDNDCPGNGLSPGRHQTITWRNYHTFSVEYIEIKIQCNFNVNFGNSVHENALKSRLQNVDHSFSELGVFI